MIKHKTHEKFIIRPLTTLNAFNYEQDLPFYDGLRICVVNETGQVIAELLALSWENYDAKCTIKMRGDIKLSDYVKDYEDFKALDAIIEKAKYHIKLAQQAAMNADILNGN